MFKFKKKDKRCIFVFIAVYYLNGMYTNCIYAKFDTITEHLTCSPISKMSPIMISLPMNDVITSYIYKYIVCTKAILNYMLLTHQIPINL